MEALTYVREARDLMTTAGFNLRAWMPNSPRLRELAEAEGCLDNDTITKVLVTGLDFTGALNVKEKSGSESKAYVCLFTCACTRTVLLEVVPNLSEESFLNAFRRFSSRKSLPTTMISDNATTYMAAASHLKKLFQSPSLQETLRNQGTEWRFIPKRAPWYGGWWESLIGLTKTSMKKTLGRAYVSLESLQTIVTEIEATMNDRPITHVSTSIADPEPLTPTHLLYGRRVTTLPYPDNSDDSTMIPTLDHSQINKRAKLQAHIISQFQKRWKFEYLTGLREYHRATGNNIQSIRVGDVVQIQDDSPRIRWKLAVVEELLTGNDGLTRAAKIRTCN
ncbi:uncharacterized protein LOC127854604 [Dreissena polymorpha]|uniref:uncharacterized protein LOC127854604 n=1 Tax=Dreissena polymorpha TaxID=45954 RepID=UPI002263D445|nr:uncharacterized protein LOC127854604 [Dreissena polymorpha]